MHALTSTLLLCAAGALAQTPPGTEPSTTNNLEVTFGQTQLSPGEELPYAYVQSAPVVTSTASGSGPFIIAMMDQDLPASIFPAGSDLVPGDGTGRTIRLHWFQTNVTGSGVLKLDNSPAYAPYEGPQPPQGDIFHKYVIYQFTQPADFVVPTEFTNGTFLIPSTNNRNNFSIAPVTSQSGVNLLAATYMRVENKNNTGAPTMPTPFIPGNGTAPAPNATTSSGSGTGTSSATPSSYTGNDAGKVVVALPMVLMGAVAAMVL